MSEITKCPKCGGEYVYFDGSLYVCPDCAHEFNEEDATATETADIAKDSNGAELFDGDSVTVIKDLKVKGASSDLKQGTKVKNIRLIDDGVHNIDCNIPGFGAMSLKSEYVKKA